MVLLLIAAGVGLFFHDKQQTADLAKAQSDNDSLTKQLGDTQAELNGLKLKVQQYAAAAAAVTQVPHNQVGPASTPNADMWGLKDSGALDRPAYREH